VSRTLAVSIPRYASSPMPLIFQRRLDSAMPSSAAARRLLPLCFLSIAAIIFPWKRKDIYEKSPSIVHQSIFGVPWIVIAGVAGLIISVLVVYFTILPALSAESINFVLPGLLVSFGFYMLLPILLYFLAVYINRKRGVSLERRFKEIPPD